jgi:ubiquinone/menaquinone biosynthesis C-methylase UbiE
MNRHALLIANGEFPKAPNLSCLATPANDVVALEAALTNKSKGDFKVETIRDGQSFEIKDRIERLLRTAADSESLAVLYYSGHGLLDPEGHLYLAAHDTEEEMYFRSIGVLEILNSVRQHNAKRVVVILDCCYSGAGISMYELKGPAVSVDDSGLLVTSRVPSLSEDLKGTGVVVMTASSAVERAHGDRRSGYGLFTKHLVEGINSAVSKVPKSKSLGIPVTVHELFEYVKRQMVQEKAPQTPHIWNLESTGDITFAEIFLKGTREQPLPARQRWPLIREQKRSLFDLIGPSYILDRAFHFLDWNSAFELLVAQPLGLQRGVHVGHFLSKLANVAEVVERANKVFIPGQDPMVDEEELQLRTEKYGVISFRKIACQIPNVRGLSKTWSVHLNISNIEKNRDQLWADMAADLRRHAVWSKYAESYDRVISPFGEYRKLLELLVSRVGKASRCIDLGAGTGNVTIKLLAGNPTRTVLAVEKNEGMLECLQRKLDENPSFKRRAFLYKGDVTTALREQVNDSFDACVMLNVLFALENPPEVLSEVFRVLARKGTLTLSTSHKQTNIRLLFNAIKRDLTMNGQFSDELEPVWLEAFYRNQEMEDMICRHSKEEIREWIEKVGFTIEEYRESEYVDCVVVYKVLKP